MGKMQHHVRTRHELHKIERVSYTSSEYLEFVDQHGEVFLQPLVLLGLKQRAIEVMLRGRRRVGERAKALDEKGGRRGGEARRAEAETEVTRSSWAGAAAAAASGFFSSCCFTSFILTSEDCQVESANTDERKSPPQGYHLPRAKQQKRQLHRTKLSN